ncbi:MAG TPA: hypothetical protein VE863_19565 [Pyrinomonadaceae bacterium]|jgi:hypothetical protein|nr:hypothetical protein [Pyrinomonadaceae bacterium]
MKLFATVAIVLLMTSTAWSQKTDVLQIEPHDLELRNLQLGDSTYIVYRKRTPSGPAEKITLVKINVKPTVVNGRKVFAITQQWDSGDEVFHTSKTFHDINDFSTIFHESWWKQLGYTMTFDFTAKRVDFKGPIEDAKKATIIDDFNRSFDSYNLCWHSDLTIFPLLPYKNGRTFAIKFYDPGFGKTENAMYDVTGSEVLVGSDGRKIDCWVMQYKFEIPSRGSGTQRFWISKRSHEVLKEEDRTPNGYRYKLKIGISGERS